MSTSGSAPIRITGLKLKSRGSTPTTVRGWPSTVRNCPTIGGSALSDVRHSRSLMIALPSSSGRRGVGDLRGLATNIICSSGGLSVSSESYGFPNVLLKRSGLSI
jgi:hypothetical protein